MSAKGIDTGEDLYVETLCKISSKLKVPSDSQTASEIRELVDAGDCEAAAARFERFAYWEFRNLARTRNRQAEKEPVRFSELHESGVEPREVGRLMPTNDVELEELRTRLARALDRLPEREREVVVGKFFAGLSNEEIAERLGCTQQAVRGYQSRALRTLACLLVDE